MGWSRHGVDCKRREDGIAVDRDDGDDLCTPDGNAANENRGWGIGRRDEDGAEGLGMPLDLVVAVAASLTKCLSLTIFPIIDLFTYAR